MNETNHNDLNIIKGLLAFVLGGILIFYSASIVFQVLLLLCGLIFIYVGMLLVRFEAGIKAVDNLIGYIRTMRGQ